MKKLLLVSICLVFAFGCKKKDDGSDADIQENAQQIGDVMASIDETGQGSGSISSMQIDKESERLYARFLPEDDSPGVFARLALPSAEAVSCFGYGWGSCSSNAVTRNYAGCTVGTATVSGSVTLNWGNGATSCTLSTAGQYITRVPNFTLTGRRGGTLAVTKTGSVGQRLTWASGTGASKVFSFTNDGINRKITLPSSNVLFDQTTTVSGTITVTGTTRASRVIGGGGSLIVTNNLTANVCTYTPTNVTWDSTSCNCPTQGSWSGSCTDGKSATLNLTGCGTADYTEGSETTSLTFDRCASN